MKKIILISALVSITLTACGGGGGGSSSSGGNSDENSGGGTTPINNNPTISVSDSSLTLDESTSTTFTVSTNDPDGDTVTVTVSDDSSAFVANILNGTVTIDAGEVAADNYGTITLTASDGNGGSAETTVSVKIKDIPNESPTIAINTQSGTADYTVIDRTELVIPFTASDTETALSALTYSVDITDPEPIQNFPFSFTHEVDVENQLVIVQIPKSEVNEHDFNGVITVTDEGGKTATAEFDFTIRKSTEVPTLTFEQVPNIMFEGQTYAMPYRLNALDIEHFNFVGIDYENDADRTENLFDFTLDETSQTITVTPKAGAAGKNVHLKYTFTFREDGLTNYGFISLNGAAAWNDNQIALSEKVDELGRHLSQAMELEYAAQFMLEALLLNGTIDQQTYQSRIEALENLEGRVLNVQAARGNYNNYVSTLSASEYYRDAATADNAIYLIDNALIQGLQGTGRHVVAVVNQYATELGLGNVLVDDNHDYTLQTTMRVSRFVGNTNYGSYQGDDWVFNTQFKWMDAIVRQAYNDSL